MIRFEYSTKIVENVLRELDKAEEYIRIAMFQIHRDDVFELLERKLEQGVKIEVFTLPHESVKPKIFESVRKNFEKIEKLGAKIYLCWWNVGSPLRTSTNVYPDSWFSFHGKFVVTEKSAITLSANFLDEDELDALLIFEKNDKQIQLYNKKFDWLIENFSDPSNKIRTLIENAKKYPKEKIPILLKPEERVKNKELREHWVRDYPGEICQEPSTINDGLYISPFDCRARSYLEKIIEESNFAFISSETLTDEDFGKFLINQRQKGKEIKLLSSGISADFQSRTNSIFQNMISFGIDVGIPKKDIHGKLVITNKRVVVSSVNINKIGLGIRNSKTLDKWRANTETITVVSDKTIIDEAKKQYESEFKDSRSFIDLLVEKEKKNVMKDLKNMDMKIDESTLEHIIREKIDDDAKSYRKHLEKIIRQAKKV